MVSYLVEMKAEQWADERADRWVLSLADSTAVELDFSRAEK